VGPAAPI
jgi:hypothetical protein